MSRPLTILVADDDRSILTIVNEALRRQGHRVRGTESGSVLWGWVADGEGDVVITDVVMPDIDGLDLLPRIRRERPDLPVIVMSARKTLDTAIRAAEGGAYEYLPKPFDINELTDLVEKAHKGESEQAEPVLDSDNSPLIGRSAVMQKVFRTMSRVVRTDLTVLVHGESGTGKELVARALHELGPRSEGPFVAVNMAAMPRDLIESELFGHERGAFTGAVARTAGRFEQARGGTLFLDEIGDMPFEAQTRLLRVLQEQEFRPVGGRRAIATDIRIIAATNRPIMRLVEEGAFRGDLYYRLNVVPIELPPLRERGEDIADLAQFFIARARQRGLHAKAIDDQAIALLEEQDWPGNVRELENLINRISALYPDERITPAILAAELEGAGRQPGETVTGNGDEGLAGAVETHLLRYFAAHSDDLPPAGLYGRVLREVERPLIRLCLRATEGNQLRAAALLGLNRNTLRKKITDLGLGEELPSGRRRRPRR